MKPKLSNDHNWNVTFQGGPDEAHWEVSFIDGATHKPLDLSVLKVSPGQTVKITSSGNRAGCNDFMAQWNPWLSRAWLEDQNGSLPPGIDLQDPGWVSLNVVDEPLIKKTGSGRAKGRSTTFKLSGTGRVFFQLKYFGSSITKRMLLAAPGSGDGTGQPMKVPTSAMLARVTIVVS